LKKFLKIIDKTNRYHIPLFYIVISRNRRFGRVDFSESGNEATHRKEEKNKTSRYNYSFNSIELCIEVYS